MGLVAELDLLGAPAQAGFLPRADRWTGLSILNSGLPT